MPTIFLCDDEEDLLRYLSKLLTAHNYRVESFSRGEELLARLDRASAPPCDAILQDVRMPDIDGLHVLTRCRARWPQIPVVIMTGHGAIDDAVHAIKQGAYDYVTKPFPKEKILGLLGRLLEHHRLTEENRLLREELHRSGHERSEIVFRSAAFREVYDLTLQVAASDANILISGESGTGKELIANALHLNSPRSSKAFVSINCATLTDLLLESQLFGHLRGAFTGAIANQKGLLEEAAGGTLFLDEIGDVSPAVQAKLLRVIQEKSFMPIGSTKARKIDVRFVAASNKDMAQEVREGRFREDLYYRLNVITLSLPPLRERREDIEPLALHFLRSRAQKMKKEIRGFEPAALDLLLRYDWPGNVRELENVIERAVILCRETTIGGQLLPLRPRSGAGAAEAGLLPLDEIERRHIVAVLKETGGHKSRTAEILGISRKTLDRKLAEAGVNG